MAEAAKTLTPVVLELGGKDPFVLLPGAKVDAAKQNICSVSSQMSHPHFCHMSTI